MAIALFGVFTTPLVSTYETSSKSLEPSSACGRARAFASQRAKGLCKLQRARRGFL